MRCLYPWTQVYVSATGIVKPCCSNIELGNIHDAAVLDVLSGASTNALRQGHVDPATTELPGDCVGCFELAKQGSLHEFDKIYSLGADVEKELQELEAGGYSAFAQNYRTVRDAYVRGVHPPPGARPLGIWCQVGERCNIRCIMCWQDHERPSNLTSDQIAQIRQLIPTAHSMQVTGGEPTVFDDFWKIVDDFRDHATPKSRLMFLTNGLLLKNKLQRFDGIENLTFAVNIDGPTRESYEKIRHLGKWNLLMENLEAIVEHKRKHNKTNWGVVTAFTLMRSNIELLAETMKLADRFGACWICQVIGGEYSPVAQCRVYFEENIFRFDHLGYSKQDIVDRLTAVLPNARALKNSPELAASCVQATIELTKNTQQFHVPARRAAEMRAIKDDHVLSRAIKEIVLPASKAAKEDVGNLIQIVGLRKKEGGGASPATAAAALELGRAHLKAGALMQALPHLQQAWETLEKKHGPGHGETAGAALELSRCLGWLGRWTEAEPIARQAYILHEGTDGQSHAATAAAAVELGKCLRGCKRSAEADPLLRQALAAYRTLQGADSYATQNAAHELAVVQMELQQHAEAASLLEGVLSLFERLFGLENGVCVEGACQLARCYRAVGRTPDAQALLLRLRDHCAAVFGSDHATTRRVALELGGWGPALTRLWGTTKRALKKAVHAARPRAVNPRGSNREHSQ